MSTQPTDEDLAITALEATDADEDTTVGLVLTALAADNANVTSLTSQLATAVAQNNPTLVASRLKALQDLNTANALTITNMKAALATPPAA